MNWWFFGVTDVLAQKISLPEMSGLQLRSRIIIPGDVLSKQVVIGVLISPRCSHLSAEEDSQNCQILDWRVA